MMIRSCLRWGYLCAIFSFLALLVAFFLYGGNVALPDEPGVTLFYRLGFVIAAPLVSFFSIESLFAQIMLAGMLQVATSFCIGVSAGVIYQVLRQ
jgi:hypothetical protein